MVPFRHSLAVHLLRAAQPVFSGHAPPHFQAAHIYPVFNPYYNTPSAAQFQFKIIFLQTSSPFFRPFSGYSRAMVDKLYGRFCFFAASSFASMAAVGPWHCLPVSVVLFALWPACPFQHMMGMPQLPVFCRRHVPRVVRRKSSCGIADTSPRCGIRCHQAGSPPQSRKYRRDSHGALCGTRKPAFAGRNTHQHVQKCGAAHHVRRAFDPRGRAH